MSVDRSSLIERLQSRMMSIDEFNYDTITAPPLSMILSQYDVDRLYNVATSLRYSGNVTKKLKAIDDILKPRGFAKLSGGTNRMCYKFLEDDRLVIKTAYNRVALQDTPAEYKNQYILKPFCTKVFEVDPSGTVGGFERVDPITSREEFASVYEEAFELIDGWLIDGEHIMADVGTHYFMNYGIRRGFGLVIMDFPYLYKLDGNKLFCSAPDINSPDGHCGGEIDFDPGFNDMYCKKCGLRYLVSEVSENIKEDKIIIRGGKQKMAVVVKVGNRVISNGQDVTNKPEADAFLNKAATSYGARQRIKPTNDAGRINGFGGGNNGNSGRYQRGQQVVRNNNDSERQSRPLPQRGQQMTQAVEEPKVEVPPTPVVDMPVNVSTDYRGMTSVSATITDQPTPGVNYQNLFAGATVDNTDMPDRISQLQEKFDRVSKDYMDLKEEYETYKGDVAITLKEKDQLIADKDNLIATKDQYISTITIDVRRLQQVDDINKDLAEQLSKAETANATMESEISSLNYEIEDLKLQIKELSERPVEQVEPDPAAYVPIDKHQEMVFGMQARVDDMQQLVNEQNTDICDFVDTINNMATYIMDAREDFSVDYQKVTCPGLNGMNANIMPLSELPLEGFDPTNDRYVLIFKYGENGDKYMRDTNEQIIAVTHINGIDVDKLVVREGISLVTDEDLYNKYFTDPEDHLLEEEEEINEETATGDH